MNPHKLRPPLTREQRYQLGFKLAHIRGSGDGIDYMTDTELLDALRHEHHSAGSIADLSERLDKLLTEAKEDEERETQRALSELRRILDGEEN